MIPFNAFYRAKASNEARLEQHKARQCQRPRDAHNCAMLGKMNKRPLEPHKYLIPVFFTVIGVLVVCWGIESAWTTINAASLGGW